MAIDQEVREHIFSVARGEEQFDAFEEWFVGASWDERTNLVAQVDHLIAETGDRDELLAALVRLASTFIEDVELTPAQNQTVVGRMAFAGT